MQDVGVLQRIRREYGGKFALNAWVARSGMLRVGDRVRLVDPPDSIEPARFAPYAERQ